MHDEQLFDRATEILHELYGPAATFRPGQYEAIEATLSNRRTLVVQRTGWGKSLVYFVATRILRECAHGLTLVVSPLISLMDNQLAAAQALGLTCEVLNGSVDKDLRPRILEAMQLGLIDVVFTTPETLFTADVQDALRLTDVGLFVIDEAHCISDWGHDFRLEYTRLRQLLPRLEGVPLLATTATATDAVVDDICRQLGGEVFVSRGPLVRDSLAIQVVRVTDGTHKLAWLLANIGQLPGTGIIYCTTTHDCDRLAEFLQENDVEARPYHAKRDAAERAETLALFYANKVKVLAATSALGMGYDKDDIAFVIHFQLPSGIVAYYQQIGRAGRKLSRAYAILLYGDQADLRIQRHFIENAFPSEEETCGVVRMVAQAPEGMRFTDLLASSNMRRDRLNKALDFLQNDGFVERVGGRYVATERPFVYAREHYEAITARRHAELQQMVDFAETSACYSQAVVRALGDGTAPTCGNCANCLGHDVFAMRLAGEGELRVAAEFVERDHLVIAPRKRWPSREMGVAMGDTSSVVRHPNQEGLCLARADWGAYGPVAMRARETGAPYADALVERSCQVLGPFLRTRPVEAVVPVPTNGSPHVRDFAARLAVRLGLPLVEALAKRPAPPQSEQHNSNYQCRNVAESISLVPGMWLPRAVLLVDDVVDSGWTMTVCGSLLQRSGSCERVYPFALVRVLA